LPGRNTDKLVCSRAGFTYLAQLAQLALIVFLSTLFAACSASTATEDTPGKLSFEGAEQVEPVVGGKWRVTWKPLTAVSDATFAVFERAENGGKFDFSEPVGRPQNRQYFETKDLRLVDSHCYTVRAIVQDSVISGSDKEACTGHQAFRFSGVTSITPQAKGNYLVSWKPTPFDGDNISFEVRERNKGQELWRSAGTTPDGFFPSREISIDETLCFNVRYIHSGLPADTNTAELCTDSESAGNFVGIDDLKKSAPNDPFGGYIVSWEKSVRSDVVGYRIYMGAGFKKRVAEVGRDENSWRATKLTTGATYELGVRLVTRSGREDGNTKILRITVDNKIPEISKVELRGVRSVDPGTGESSVKSIRCSADFTDTDRSSGFIFPKIEFKARLAAGERPTVLRKRVIGTPVRLDSQGRGTVNADYQLDFSRDRRGNDLYCEVTVFDGLDPSLPKASKFIFLPDSPAIATGMFISKRAWFDPSNGTTHYYGPVVGGEPAQVIENADGSKESHACMVPSAEGNIPNPTTLDICEDTSVSIVIKGAKIPERLFETGKESDLATFKNKLLYSPGDIGDDYQAFYADENNRAKVGYWDPDAGDIASVIELRSIYNGSVTSSQCLEGVCDVDFKLHPNFASGSVYSELGPDGQPLKHAQFEYRVRTYVPSDAEGSDLNGTASELLGWSNWAILKVEVTGVDEPPIATGATVLATEDLVQRVVLCNDINSDPDCGPPAKLLALNPAPTDPLLRYLSGKGFGYFDLEDDPPVRTLVSTFNNAVLPGQWVKPAAGIPNPNPAVSANWDTVTAPLTRETSCDQTQNYCPFQCSRSNKKCVAYFRPNQDFNGSVSLRYDTWTEVNLTTNPDAQYANKPPAEREVKTGSSGVLTVDVAPVNDPASVGNIRTMLWNEDEVDSVLHRINFVPVTNYVAANYVPERVEYYDPDGDLLRRAGDIEIRFLDNGQLHTSYCTISGETDRLPANYPGTPGVTAGLCRTDIGKVKYRPLPPNANADAALPTLFNAAIQWNCDGAGGCFGDLVLPPNYNSFLDQKPIEFEYRMRTTQLINNSVRVRSDDWSAWQTVSLTINPVPDAPMVHVISLSGTDSENKSIDEDKNFKIKLIRGRGVPVNISATERHYQAYFDADVDETNDVAYDVKVVDIFKSKGPDGIAGTADDVPVIYDSNGTNISASLPSSALFTCDNDGICSGEFKAAQDFFTNAGEDAFFQIVVSTCPRADKIAGNCNSSNPAALSSDPAVPGRVSFTIASIDDKPTTGGAGVIPGIPEDENHVIAVKRNPAASELGYTEVEPGDRAEKIEFTDITYYEPFYLNNATQTLRTQVPPNPILDAAGQALNFFYGASNSLSANHGFPFNTGETYAPNPVAINRSLGNQRNLLILGEYFAGGAGTGTSYINEANLESFLLPADATNPSRYQFVCRRFPGDGLQDGECRFIVRSPLNFNTDNKSMSGRRSSMRYRIYTRDPAKWKEPTIPTSDENGGRWSDWKSVDLLFSPVNDPPVLRAPLVTKQLTRTTPTDTVANSPSNRVQWTEDQEGVVYFDWLNSYTDLDYNTESFTFEYDKVTAPFTPGSWKAGMFSNARSFLASKLSVDLTAVKTVFHDTWYESQPPTLFRQGPNSWGYISNTFEFLQSREGIANPNGALIARSFGIAQNNSGMITLPVSGTFDFNHNLNRLFTDLNFSVYSHKRSVYLSNLELRNNFTLTALNDNVTRISRTGDNLLNGYPSPGNASPDYSFGDDLTIRVAASGWNQGTIGQYLGTPAADNAVSSTTNINCDPATGECRLYLQMPPDFAGTIDANVRIASGSQFPLTRDWSDELNTQPLHINVRNVDDLPQILVPEMTVDIFDGEFLDVRFGRIPRGLTSCSQIEGASGFRAPAFVTGTSLSSPIEVAMRPELTPYNTFADCQAVGIPSAVQDDWLSYTAPPLPSRGCSALGVVGGFLGTSKTGPGEGPYGGDAYTNYCATGLWLYNFVDADRKEMTGLKIMDANTTVAGLNGNNPLFRLEKFTASDDGRFTTVGTPLGTSYPTTLSLTADPEPETAPAINTEFLRVRATSKVGNAVFRAGATSGRPFDYLGGTDAGLGGLYFDYQIKTNNEVQAITNTVDCSDPANCWSNTARVYIRIHGNDDPLAANNKIATTVRGVGQNVAEVLTMNEDGGTLTLTVGPDDYSDSEGNAAPFDKPIGIAMCSDLPVPVPQGAPPGIEQWEDFDNNLFEWSPDFEYREATQVALSGGLSDTLANERSWLRYERYAASGSGSLGGDTWKNTPTSTKLSLGTLLLTAGTPQAYQPGRIGGVFDSRAYTSRTENNGLQSNCSLSSNLPSGTCSMQIRPQPNLNGEFLVCLQVRSFAKTGDRVVAGMGWSDPIYFKVVVNPVDDPPRIGQLAVRGRGNEDHLIPIEVRPGKFEWVMDLQSTLGTTKTFDNTGAANSIYYYGMETGKDREGVAAMWSKDRFTAIRPGYWDYDSNMGDGSPDLAEFLYVNMAQLGGDLSTGIGSGAINHAANPDTATLDSEFDLPCSAGIPANNICVIKCRSDGVCPFRFQPPVHSDQNFKLQYWIQAKGGKKLSTRRADNTVAARGGDASYDPYESAGEYDNYPYHHCLPSRQFDMDRWRYVQEEPKMSGSFDLAAVSPVTQYYGAPYYDQLSPPLASRTLLSFVGSNPLRVIVPMQKDSKLSNVAIRLKPVSPVMNPAATSTLWQGPGIPEAYSVNGLSISPGITPPITNQTTESQAEDRWRTSITNYSSGFNRALVDRGDKLDLVTSLFPRPTQRLTGGKIAQNTVWPGAPLRPLLMDDIDKQYAQTLSGDTFYYHHEELKVINRSQPQGPAPGVVPFIPPGPGWPYTDYYSERGCNQSETGFISITVEPVPDKPQTPSSIARSVSGRLANEIIVSNQEDPVRDGYKDGDGDSVNGLGFLEVTGTPNWSITASSTPPASPVGLTLLERDPPSGPRSDGARARYWLKTTGSNASGPAGCVSGAGLCRLYFHPGPGFSGALALDYIVRTGPDNWESDDGVNPASCAGNAMGLSCIESAPGRMNLTIVNADPVILKPGSGEPFYVNEDAGSQQIMVSTSATPASFNVDEGGGPEQDPKNIVVTFSGCDEITVKCANIFYSRNDAAYGSTTSPANNMGAVNGTISVQPEANWFTAAPMTITMRAAEVDASNVPVPGAFTQVTFQLEVRPQEDLPVIGTDPLASPNYVTTEDNAIVISGVTIDEGGGVDEDSQAIVVSFDSSNKPVLPNANIVLSPADESAGDTGNFGATPRTITITPVPNAFTPPGTPISITMTVSDGNAAPVTRVLQVEFTAVNDPPVLTSSVPLLKGASEYSAAQLTPLVISGITFDEGGAQTGTGNEDSQTVSVSFVSSRTDVIDPATDVILSGTPDSAGIDAQSVTRTLTITPKGFNALGESTDLTMRLFDGTATVNYVIAIRVARPPSGPITCGAPSSNIIGAGQLLPALVCSGLQAAASPGTGSATYALDASTTCTSASIGANGGSGGTMTLSGSMNTNGDCNVVVSGTDGGTPLQKVPPSQRHTQSFLMAKVTDISFGTPTIASTCTSTIPMTVTYRGGYSSYSSGTITGAAGGTGAFSGLSIASSALTATLNDFSKATDALDVSVVDTKGSSLGKALILTITAALVQSLEPKDPAATVTTNRSPGLQIPIADGNVCVNPSCLTQTSALLAAGPNTSCTLAASGKLHCWGLNDMDGILGNGTVTAGVNPVPVDIETTLGDANFTAIRSVSIGGSHSCAVTATGRLWCWGSNSQGQLALPLAMTYRSSPTEIVSSSVAAVATGLDHTCYLKTDGKVYCTGANGRGQLGDGSTLDSTTWKDTGLVSVVALAAAGENTCALAGAAGSRTLYCWGDDTTFQTGRSAISGYSATPSAVDAINSSFVANGVSLAMAGATAKGQVCLLTRRDSAPVDVGTLRCFGDNAAGQLGRDPVGLASTGNAANSAVSPAFTPSVPAIAGIAMGAEHSCAITTGRSLYCFGQRADGRIGSGATTTGVVHVPTLVTGSTGTQTVAVSAGDAHTCAISTDHTNGARLSCFGKGTDGALGNNTTTSSFNPADLFNNTPSFQPSARRCYGYTVTSP